MNPTNGTHRRRIALGAVIVLVTSLSFMGSSWAFYPPNGLKVTAPGVRINPDDGMCVIGLSSAGSMLVDWSITNARDCVAWTRSGDGSVNLAAMTTSDQCTKTATAGNDGYKHAWSTSLCYDLTNNRGISRVDLDNTDAMCAAKGGAVVTTGKCVAYGWIYRNRKADNTLPVSGTGISATDGVQSSDNLGFCYTGIRMTGGTYTAATCPAYHNAIGTAPGGEWTAFGAPTCLSSTSGCQTQASYDAGLNWSFSSSRCTYAFGTKGNLNAAVVNAAGTSTPVDTFVDLTGITNQGDCLAAGYSWDNWLPRSDASPKTSLDGGDFTGMPATFQLMKFDALTPVEGGGGDFGSGTGFVCQKCHSDESRSYQERNKPGFFETRHQKAGDDPSKPFAINFEAGTSIWGLDGVQCSMCHSTARPAQDDFLQVVPAGVVGPPSAGDPKSATGHNQTEYGAHLLDLCVSCHGTMATPATTNPASVIPVASGNFALTSRGLPPIANQFLNSPHAMYTGTSTKVDIGNKDNYTSSFDGYICRSAAGVFRSNAAPGDTQANCEAAGHQWFTVPSYSATPFCAYTQASCLATTSTGQWTTTFDPLSYPWAAGAGGPGGVCYGVGIGSIITTIYANGEAERIHNLDRSVNPACTNTGPGGGAAGFWVKDGETSPGIPTDTAQGTCMTCHDVHWALASTNPEAEPLRRECTTCHSHPVGEGSVTGAPQINLATINHLGGKRTPLEHMASEPSEACETCHMPKSAETGASSPMHLWRINIDPNYHTMGAGQANTTADGGYPNAAWVDLDHACGQCHGGSGPAKPDIIYLTTEQLARAAKGMHASAAQNFAVTFTASIDPLNPLKVDVASYVECGGACPTFTYEWIWGDNTAHGAVDPATHTYAVGGTYAISLVVRMNGADVGASTRSVTLSNTDAPPTVAGTCIWNADTWTMQLVDTSTDDRPGVRVIADWGDGGAKTNVTAGGAPVFKTYGIVGSFIVTQTAIDSKPQTSSRTCGTATPTYFTVTGTVSASNGTTRLSSATVTLKKGSVTLGRVTTGADGAFSFGSLKPATNYTITVTRTGYTFAVPTASFPLGPSQALALTAAPAKSKVGAPSAARGFARPAGR